MASSVEVNDEDVISLGKLRRRRLPPAAISYDPTYGIRVEDEDAPREPRAAAAWLRATKCGVRIFKAVPNGHPAVDEFLAALRGKTRP